jgi:hypothetical protein
MRFSALLGYLSARYLEMGDHEQVQLILEDAITHDKKLYKIIGIEMSHHKKDSTKAALQVLARLTSQGT